MWDSDFCISHFAFCILHLCCPCSLLCQHVKLTTRSVQVKRYRNPTMATALATPKLRRKEVPKDKCLCEYCTAKCCRYFALPIEAPEDLADFEFIRWFLLHDRATVFKEDDDWYLLVHTDVPALAGRQSLRHLRHPPADLPRLLDQGLRVRRRLDLRLLPGAARAGRRVHGGRAARRRPAASAARSRRCCRFLG